MTPYLQDPDVTLHHGDVLEVLRELPDESVDCAATSPPFFGLRDYQTGRWEGGDEGCDHRKADGGVRNKGRDRAASGGTFHDSPRIEPALGIPYADTCGKCGARRIDQQIGLEATPEEWRDRLVEVFREVRRVLVPTGTLWVECGDSYASSPGKGGSGPNSKNSPTYGRASREPLSWETVERLREAGSWESAELGAEILRKRRVPDSVAGCKPKDLIGSPFLLAFGLRDDGWWWRSTNIWHKPNCLPESVTDRPVVSHSYVFQFSKKARYFHDAEAVREPAEWARWGDQTVVKEQQGKGNWIGPKSKAELRHAQNAQALAEEGSWASGGLDNGKNWPDGRATGGPAEGASKSLRSVWTIPTQGFPEAHFATWPTKLAERILLMACPESVCRVCGVPRTRITDVSYEKSPVHGKGSVQGRHYETGANNFDGAGIPRLNKVTETTGFTDCGHDSFRPGVVLDPFAGSGTTCFVARKLGRRSVGIDLSAEYLDLAARRLQQQSLFAEEVA